MAGMGRNPCLAGVKFPLQASTDSQSCKLLLFQYFRWQETKLGDLNSLILPEAGMYCLERYFTIPAINPLFFADTRVGPNWHCPCFVFWHRGNH